MSVIQNVPGAEDIRDIRAPFAFPAWWHWPLAIAVAAILSLAIVLAFRAWQKRRAAKRTPLERARKALALAETHARAGQAHAWGDIVAETLRAALAQRLGQSVLPQNTSELAKAEWALPARPPISGENAVIRAVPYLDEAPDVLEILSLCDLARFALASAGADALLAHTELARKLVEKFYAPPPKPKTLQLQQAAVSAS